LVGYQNQLLPKNILSSNMESLKKNKALMQEIQSHSITGTYPKGSRIWGKELNSIPIVLSGVLKISQSDDKGAYTHLYYVQANETCVVSIVNVLFEKECTLTAMVQEEAEIMFIPIDKAKEWFKEYPEWIEFILHSYHQRFDDLLGSLKSANAEKLETRVLKYLRQRRAISGGKIVSITHQHLADDLSTNRVVVSRLLKTLENKGVLKLGRNKIELREATVWQ